MMPSSPFRRLFHWGPIAVLCIIKLITWAMVHHLGMYWPPHSSTGAAIHATIFLGLAAATLYYFLQSLLEGPGFVPLCWRPANEADTEFLQYCTVCRGHKPPRSHHCRKCGACVKKMDHHCPWINCCVGHSNHGYFNMFLVAAVFGCSQASVILSISMYHAINRVVYIHSGADKPMIYLSLTTLLLTLLAIGMAVGVVLAVGALFYLQLRGILRNCTTIEEWILEKAVTRRAEQGLPSFVFPYDLGWRRNLTFVMYGEGDGFVWPLREGTGPYDLTVEQIAQKAEKRLRSRLFSAIMPYSGRWVPIISYTKAALPWHTPCTDEPRLPLALDDVIRATRQRKHWVFGEKLLPTVGDSTPRGPRGWFPRAAVVPTGQCKSKPD